MTAHSDRIMLRLTEAQRRRYQAAAEARGLSLSEYLRQCADDAAAETCPECGGTGRAP